MTYRELLTGACQQGMEAHEALTLLEHLFSLSRTSLLIHMDEDCDEQKISSFEQMAARAAEIQAETGEKINVTGNIYPHIQPSDGAEMMFLYATDADMRTAEAERGTRYETIYVSDDMQPEADQIYLARANEISNWDLEGFDYEESEGYALIYPAR